MAPSLYTNEIYHVYNRTIGKTPALSNQSEVVAFLNTVRYYKYQRNVRYSIYKREIAMRMKNKIPKIDLHTPSSQLVEVYAYAVMPNHYHFLLKQLKKNGIQTFIATIQNSYARSYNLLENRNGGLFQRSFKTNHISNDTEFSVVSRYIHLNPVVANLVDLGGLPNYPYTSYKIYAHNISNDPLVTSTQLMERFKSFSNYERFVHDHLDYIKRLKEVKLHTFTITPDR